MKENSKIYFYFCVFVTFLMPGLGHVLWGHYLLGIGLSVAVILLSLIGAYFAVLGAWTIALILIFGLGIYIGLVYSLYKLNRRSFKIFPLFVVLIIFIGYDLVIYDQRRVQAFTLPSPVMEPLILEGDSIAIDTAKSVVDDLKVGDIVKVIIPEREGQYIRKVQSISEGKVVVVANDPVIPAETISLENITGRALYVIYSFDSKMNKMRWNRILNPSLL
jgi:signal peptidase I